MEKDGGEEEKPSMPMRLRKAIYHKAHLKKTRLLFNGFPRASALQIHDTRKLASGENRNARGDGDEESHGDETIY